VDAYLEKWRKAAVNRVCEVFQLVKRAEMEKFGEKSYFYRKGNGLAYLVWALPRVGHWPGKSSINAEVR